MCGIVGTISDQDTTRVAIEALKRLEYRGYDSFGIAILDGASIEVKKDIGSVTQADQNDFFKDLPSANLAIAHTRWATHGGVKVSNAHPHLSADAAFAVVHNGVIENFRTVRKELSKKGIQFQSDTDTEVIVQLLAYLYKKSGSFDDAFTTLLDQLEGEYAIVCCSTHQPGKLYAARHKSPLAYASIEDGIIIASDQRAIAPLTQSITFLEDGDYLIATSSKVQCFSLVNGSPEPIHREPTKIEQRDDDTSLHGYPHYMLKEIHETPIAVSNVLTMQDDNFTAPAATFNKNALNLVGAGSAYYVSLFGQYLFADIAAATATVFPSDEFANLKRFTNQDHLIAISQSGETFDTLEIMKKAQQEGAKVTAVNNVIASSCQRIADFKIFQGAGPEICVLSTKSILSQVMVLYRLAIEFGKTNGTLSNDDVQNLIQEAHTLPQQLEELVTTHNDHIKEVATKFSHIPNWFFIGRDVQYPVAMESALKFKEVSYLHAEGMPAGFLKHGTISLIDKNFYTIAFLPHKNSAPDIYRFTLSNVEEIQARNGNVIVVGHDEEITEDLANLTEVIVLPHVNKHLDPLLQLVAGQLLAYHCAVALGKNIDQPRALAKSVTVR